MGEVAVTVATGALILVFGLVGLGTVFLLGVFYGASRAGNAQRLLRTYGRHTAKCSSGRLGLSVDGTARMQGGKITGVVVQDVAMVERRSAPCDCGWEKIGGQQ